MTDIDGEVETLKAKFEQSLLDGDAVQDGQMVASTYVWEFLSDALPEALEHHSLALLSRIKEEVIGEDEAGGYSRGVQPVRNNLREKQRIKLDNIAKEIRGEGHE